MPKLESLLLEKLRDTKITTSLKYEIIDDSTPKTKHILNQ